MQHTCLAHTKVSKKYDIELYVTFSIIVVVVIVVAPGFGPVRTLDCVAGRILFGHQRLQVLGFTFPLEAWGFLDLGRREASVSVSFVVADFLGVTPVSVAYIVLVEHWGLCVIRGWHDHAWTPVLLPFVFFTTTVLLLVLMVFHGLLFRRCFWGWKLTGRRIPSGNKILDYWWNLRKIRMGILIVLLYVIVFVV